MTKETEEILNTLKNISKSILGTYKSLAHLETNNLQITEDYFQTLVSLNSSIKLESEMISKLFYDEKATLNVFLYLLNQMKENDEVSIILNEDEEKLIIYRLFEVIRIFLLNNPQKISELGLEAQFGLQGIDMEDSKDILENEEFQNQTKELNSLFLCSKAFLTDINMIYMVVLNKKIENETNKRIREELITSKFKKLFVTPLIEEDLLNKAFNIPTDVYLNIYMIASIYHISPEIVQGIINMNKEVVYNSELHMLMPNPLTRVYVSKTELELYLREVKLRTILSFYTPEEVQEANEEFHEFVEDLNESFFDDTTKTITKAFKAYNNDKTLIKKVSLG